MVEGFAEFAQRNPGVVKGVVGTALALSGLRVASLAVGYAVTAIKGPVLSVMGFIARWRATGALASMGRFGPVAMRVAGVVRTVGTAIAAIGGGPIAVAVGALTAGALVVRKYWQPISAFMGGMWDGSGPSSAPRLIGSWSACARCWTLPALCRPRWASAGLRLRPPPLALPRVLRAVRRSPRPSARQASARPLCPLWRRRGRAVSSTITARSI